MTDEKSQLTLEQVRRMSPDQVAHATLQGRCNALLGAPVHETADPGETPASGQIIDSAQLATMTPDEIAKATREGRFDLLASGISVQTMRTMDPARWCAVMNNLTPEQYASAKERGLIPSELSGEKEPTESTSADQGARGDRPSGSIADVIRGMSPEAIAKATREGRFDQYLKGRGPHR
jgi:hypothetical protein